MPKARDLAVSPRLWLEMEEDVQEGGVWSHRERVRQGQRKAGKRKAERLGSFLLLRQVHVSLSWGREAWHRTLKTSPFRAEKSHDLRADGIGLSLGTVDGLQDVACELVYILQAFSRPD